MTQLIHLINVPLKPVTCISLITASVIWIRHLSTSLPFEGCSSLYNFSFLHTPRPCRSACSGFSSPFLGRQRSPRVHGPVYTPHGWPSSSAHVRQQPQPGSFTSWQPTGTGGHMDRAFWSHGWHGTYDEPQPVMLSRGTTRKETLRSMVRFSSKLQGVWPKPQRLSTISCGESFLCKRFESKHESGVCIHRCLCAFKSQMSSDARNPQRQSLRSLCAVLQPGTRQ